MSKYLKSEIKKAKLILKRRSKKVRKVLRTRKDSGSREIAVKKRRKDESKIIMEYKLHVQERGEYKRSVWKREGVIEEIWRRRKETH